MHRVAHLQAAVAALLALTEPVCILNIGCRCASGAGLDGAKRRLFGEMLQPLLCDLMPQLSKSIKDWDQPGELAAVIPEAATRAHMLMSLTDRLASCYNCLLTPGLDAIFLVQYRK